ncbi:MAG: hypothetical protein U9R79_22670 [Armatimonadota bacterium]|nr:hypothetical protein [Armatimonadota bacterium]
MSVEFYVYELGDDESEEPRRLSWDGWWALDEWLNEEGLDAEGLSARQFEFQQVRQVLEQTAEVEEGAARAQYVSPLPDLRNSLLIFGFETEEWDYIVSAVELPWLLPQAVNGWEAALAFNVERIGGRDTHGYFNDEE